MENQKREFEEELQKKQACLDEHIDLYEQTTDKICAMRIVLDKTTDEFAPPVRAVLWSIYDDFCIDAEDHLKTIKLYDSSIKRMKKDNEVW